LNWLFRIAAEGSIPGGEQPSPRTCGVWYSTGVFDISGDAAALYRSYQEPAVPVRFDISGDAAALYRS
jgi:hypothetical protein